MLKLVWKDVIYTSDPPVYAPYALLAAKVRIRPKKKV